MSWLATRSCISPVFVGLVLVGGAHGAELEYNRDIRPILAENCFACHGPDSAARKANLRLDQREAAVQAKAFIPGKADDSELVRRIFADDADERMPPHATKKSLSSKEKETLKRWIAAGAVYQPHWSFMPPQRVSPPAVKNAAWVRNPIDNFVLQKLERAGLQPAPEADRRTLARRLSLDLLGLPPSPKEVEDFVNDRSPKAYEKYVDHLLASQHWGEHRGRYWLDAARYADTHGIHFDNYREMWSYRDWVIGALNQNMPFDQFTIEQLAGDLLPNPTLDQRIATGFNRCNITTNEGGAINEEYLVLYARDRTETTAQVWMGLTAGCAVCHDHKFDPVTTRDFYALSAFFNNTSQAALDGNIPNTPPIIQVPRREDRPRWDALMAEIDDVKARTDARKTAARPDFTRWLKEASPEQVARMIPSNGLQLHVPLTEEKGQDFGAVLDGKPRSLHLDSGLKWGNVSPGGPKGNLIQPGGSLEFSEAGDFERGDAFSVGAMVMVSNRNKTGALLGRMDNTRGYRGWDLWLENGRIGMHIINQWPSRAIKVISKSVLTIRQWQHVVITYDGKGKAEGVSVWINGKPEPVEVQSDSLSDTIRTPVPLKIGQRFTSDRIQGAALQEIRLYDRALAGAEVEQLTLTPPVLAILKKPASQRTAKEKDELFSWWLITTDKPYRELERKLIPLQQEKVVLQSRGTVAHVMNEKPGEPMAYVLFRGDYDKRRDPVKANTPRSMPALPSDLPHNRLGLAQWLVRPDHPLTARVTVNRFWQEVFGNGIVRTTGDFGVAGELPSHPELLDWLPVEFRESGWDVKKLFKLIVTSAAYRQAAVLTPEKLAKDPHNRLLSRGPHYRMDAEMIRDYALAASGLLVPKIGGPSVKPYQPGGVWEAVAMIGSNTRDYRQDHGESLYRRSLYTFIKRAAPPASMEVLNAPNREVCQVRRERTDTPLQALVTLNDPQFVEAARHLAEVTLKDSKDSFDSRLDKMSARLVARSFKPAEKAVMRATLNDLLAHYQARPDEAKKLLAVGESKADATLDVPTFAAWTMLANELMNLDEVLNK